MGNGGEIRLTDRSRASGGLFGVLFGGCFTMFAVFFLVVSGAVGALSGGDSFPGPAGWLFVIVPGVFLVVGLGIVGGGLRKLWLRYLFGTPMLIVPAQDILLGDVLTTRFERSGGSARARRGRRTLSAELVCQEIVTYGRGTDTETVRHEVKRVPLQVTMDDHPTSVAGRIMLSLPVDWPPSIDLRHNKVHTLVEAVVHAPDLPEDRSSFTLFVRPAVRAGGLQ